MLDRFEVVARLRPVAIVQPGTDLPCAPYAAVETDLGEARTGRACLVGAGVRLSAVCSPHRLHLEITPTGAGRPRRARRRSLRHGWLRRRPDAVALSLTGPLLTGWVREGGEWVARARLDLSGARTGVASDLGRLVHDERWLGRLRAEGDRSGTFGQLGLRDLRLVTSNDGTPYRPGDEILLSATSAGPGGFRSAHASVWALDPDRMQLSHRGDLFFRRAGADGRPGVYGDHAVHLVHDPDPASGTHPGPPGPGRWLVAASTWGDFDRHRRPGVRASLSEVGPRPNGSAATTRPPAGSTPPVPPAGTPADAPSNGSGSGIDPTTGGHLLDSRPLELPTTGLTSVGVWDPHLVRTKQGWLVAFVSATRFFAFHPVVAAGPDLDSLSLLAAAPERRATEGPTLLRFGERPEDPWLLAASDGRDGAGTHPIGFPLLGLDDPPRLPEHGRLRAAYPTNLPWPSLVRHAGGWLMIGFDGRTTGGRLTGYGTHGDVVVQRTHPRPAGREGEPIHPWTTA